MMYFEKLSICEFIQEWPGPSGKIHDKDTLTISFRILRSMCRKRTLPENAPLTSCSNWNATLCFIQITALLQNRNTFPISGFKGVFQTPH